jgi:hypothetical protein
MRVIRILSLAAAGLLGLGTAACVSTVTGRATIAADAGQQAGPSGTPSTTDSPSASASEDPSPTDSPTPTVDPVKVKEQVTCVLIQATVKTTNDKFNAAKTRETQITILGGGASGVLNGLRRSGLARNDRIFVLGSGIYNELRKLVSSAQHGSSPSTAPYNNATNKFRTACLSL